MIKKAHIQKFNETYNSLENTEKEISEIKTTIELRKEVVSQKIENYELKDSLTEKQEDILDDFQTENDELEEQLEQLEEFIEHIEEAMSLICFDLDTLTKHRQFLEAKLEKMRE